MIFADDTSLFVSGSDPAETSAILNRDLQRIASWATKWKVKFNTIKTKSMIFSNRILNNSPPLIFNDCYIDLVNSHRHLGLYLSSTLDWSKQYLKYVSKQIENYLFSEVLNC